MRTPADKTIVFTFGSHPMKDSSQRWLARLTFPAGADETTDLPITIVDGEENPVADGLFEFAGRGLPVKDGRTSIAYADFISGKHETALWLHRRGMPPVPGGLTFA